MKKKATKTRTGRRTVKRTTSRSSSLIPVGFSVRRVVIWTAVGTLLLFVFNPTKQTVSNAVEGASIFRPLYAQAVVHWAGVENTSTYNIYYKQKGDSEFSNAIRDIPGNVTTYTVSYLKKNTDYEYKISAKNADGAEFWWSDVHTLSDITSM